MPKQTFTVALAGNPNSGKTTIFNNLTGTRQKVGNWPGVTVEKKQGHIKQNGYDITIVDLPGTYSLTAYSIEEIVARDFILDEKPDVVVVIIDASNLERNLYLATQIRELDTKVIFALNMVDVAQENKIKIDKEKLSELLDVPVVPMVGTRNKGTNLLLNTIISVADPTKGITHQSRRVKYGHEIEKAISKLETFIRKNSKGKIPYNPRWTAVKLLEDDTVVKERVLNGTGAHGMTILDEAFKGRQRIFDLFNDEPEIVMTEQRYGFITGIIREVQKTSSESRVDISRNIDKILTNRILGIPIFILVIWGMFQTTFTLGAYPMEWLDFGVGWVGETASRLLPPGVFQDLVVNGIISGVGGVIVFLPNIMILFFFIALFEDTGYMARAAFLMDKVMHLIGLHGKSFIPMLMGFGCNVPAIMATRTLESKKDRILSILINPLMSCSARLPVYILLAGTFFAANAGNVIFSMYLLGIILAIAIGRLFRTIFFKGEVAPFVMELPPYRAPTFRNLMLHMWDRSKIFLRKMGGIILVGSVIVWFLSSFPQNVQQSTPQNRPAEYGSEMTRDAVTIAEAKGTQAVGRMENSYIGRLGKFIAPVFAPIGIDWRGSVAILTGLVAKELVVSTMGVLYAAEDEENFSEALKSALRKSGMTSASALSFMVFVLIYIPCFATIAAIRRETNSWKWPFFSITYSTALAWIVAFIVYQGGKVVGI
ncbi:MAG: ferrous iron transport protein B [Deltaproteobacteria bacterium]|nr:ferrous iron transport protein B [Deltaproteobacteria bacterium]